MATDVNLEIGLNMEIGSVPVSMAVTVDQQSDKTVYTFDGTVQDAVIPLGKFFSFIGQQFPVGVQLPPEINMEALIDYVVGQVIYTTPNSGKSTTELGVAAKFELIIDANDKYIFTFYADTIFAPNAPASGNPFVVGASIDLNLDFANLPLVGLIPGFNDLTLTNVGFSYTNDNQNTQFNIPQVDVSANPLYTRNDPKSRNTDTYKIVKNGDQETFTITKEGFALTAGFNQKSTGEVLNNWALPMSLPASNPPATNPPPASYYPAETSPPETSVHWVDIDKTFGPVDLKKIGLNYSGGEATFGFTANFTLGGFNLGLEQMAITFPFPLPGQPAGNTLSFDLQGLSLDYKKGNFEIGGAFQKVVENDITSYYGQAILKFSNFGFKALGGYIGEDPASFFLYLNINAPIGGPPYLFITGLAGGFGINNSLKLPTIDQLPTYLLLPSNAPAEEGTAISTVNDVLPQLQSIFQYQAGEFWAAAGIQFTSFEMINAFVLVTISFGVDFQVGILGTCSMTFPTGDPSPIAFIEVDLIASFTPATGLLSVDGRLSPSSFIYGGFVKLSGGFAFYIWFSGEHAGQFVVSVGGYHPAFVKPDYYPTVPRLQMSFGLGPFQVTGQAYFALTPAMMMAGINMSAVWNSGPIKAWFDAGIDFLLAWAPFHYEATAYVNIGCSVDLGLFTINVSVGADLAVWGPEFGGQAHVDLDVVSFTIAFGAAQRFPAPIGWNTFKTNFLPQDNTPSQSQANIAPAMPQSMAFAAAAAPALASAPADTNIIKASVATGLLLTDIGGFDWIVDPNAFQIVTNSTIPANNGEWALTDNTYADIPDTISDYNPATPDYSSMPFLNLPEGTATFSSTDVWNPDINIGPIDQANVQSYHTISLAKHSNSDPVGFFSAYITTISVQPVLSDSGTALWGVNNPNQSANDVALVPKTLVGFIISPVPRNPSSINNVPLLQLIFGRGNATGFNYQQAHVNPDFTVQSDINAQEELIIDISGDTTQHLVNQDYILSSLADPWVSSQRADILADLNTNGFSTYAAADINITDLATQKSLVDWPQVRMIGSDAA